MTTLPVPSRRSAVLIGFSKRQVWTRPNLTPPSLKCLTTCGHVCVNLSLPCNQESCVNYSLTLEGARLALWSFSYTYPKNFSILVAQPFLYHTVVSQMESAIRARSVGLPYYHFTFSFTHDSLLMPLLNVLHLPQDEWPPYATRLVFELWRKKGTLANEKDPYYLRILLNGQSLTHKLTHINKEHFVVDRELVHYPAWVATVTSGPYRDVPSYKKACT